MIYIDKILSYQEVVLHKNYCKPVDNRLQLRVKIKAVLDNYFWIKQCTFYYHNQTNKTFLYSLKTNMVLTSSSLDQQFRSGSSVLFHLPQYLSAFKEIGISRCKFTALEDISINYRTVVGIECRSLSGLCIFSWPCIWPLFITDMLICTFIFYSV